MGFFLYRKLTGNPWTSRVKQINWEPCVGKWKASVLRISTILLLVSGYREKNFNLEFVIGDYMYEVSCSA